MEENLMNTKLSTIIWFR